jgi:hypothetical protein
MPSLQIYRVFFPLGYSPIFLFLLEFSFLDSKELESSHQCIKLQFKRILQDQFIQSWFSDMNKSSRGQFYGLFKNEFKLEPSVPLQVNK